MGIRRNILTSDASRDAFATAALALDQEFPGFTTADLNVPGPSVELSTWDLFALWHYFTMNTPTPPGSSRNAAHRGPVFLPWHRWFLLLMEFHMQRLLGDSDFGLPYWDWATDGDVPPDQQAARPIWDSDHLGGSGAPVTTGPFAFDGTNTTTFRVRVAENVFTGQLESVDRGLQRDVAGAASLPTTAHVRDALDLSTYDRSPYSASSGGFRNRLEGWSGSGLHNRVHVWVGGDMTSGTSPNDPVFYLNHCYVDRIWEAWMLQHNRDYRPDDSAAQELFRHRLSDPLVSMLTSSEPSVSDMLSVTSFYEYDALPA